MWCYGRSPATSLNRRPSPLFTARKGATMIRRVILTASLLFLAGCSLAPDFTPPPLEIPATFKEGQSIAGDAQWKQIEAMENTDRGAWWELFNDPLLNVMEEQAAGASPTL